MFLTLLLLLPASLTPQTAAKAAADLRARIIAFVAEHRGQFSKTRLRDIHSGWLYPITSS